MNDYVYLKPLLCMTGNRRAPRAQEVGHHVAHIRKTGALGVEKCYSSGYYYYMGYILQGSILNTNNGHAYLRAYLSAVGVGVAVSVVLCLVTVSVAATPRVTVLGGEQEVEQGSQRCGENR